MKKSMTLVLAWICMLGLAGCGSEPANTIPSNDATVENTAGEVQTDETTTRETQTEKASAEDATVEACTGDIPPEETPAEEPFAIAVSYANWSEKPEIYMGACNTEKMAVSSVHHLPIFKLDTLEDLEQFKLTYGSILTMDRGYNEIPSFHDTVASYDEAFFEENTLMLVYVTATSGSYRFGVNGISCDAGVFCMHIEQLNHPEAYTDDMAGWFITAAVPDDRIADCTVFDADLCSSFDEQG